MEIGAIWRQVQARLGPEAAPREGRQLVQHVLGLDDNALILSENTPFPAAKEAELEGLVLRRLGGEPLAYILGFAWFYGRKWKVTPDVLIPRPDTEVLVEACLARIGNDFRILEIGVGSGCVMGTLLAERKDLRAVGVDIARRSAAVAFENLKSFGLESGGEVAVGDGFAAAGGGEEPFNLIVSNPPYVTDAEWENLEPGVKDFEPRVALTGGDANPDGLTYYRKLAQQAHRLVPGGWLCVETGWQQAQAVRQLLEEQEGPAWCEISIVKDLAGRERVVCAKKGKGQRNPGKRD